METTLRDVEKQTVLNIFKLVKESWPKDVDVDHTHFKTEIIKKTAEVAGVSMATVYDITKEDQKKDQAHPHCQWKQKKNCTPKIKDQTKIHIAKIYHYLEHEYEALKKRYVGLDLTCLSKFSQRTALATGVSESFVLEIVQEEERQSTDMQQEQLQKQSLACKISGQTESSSEEDGFESHDEQSSTIHLSNRAQTKIDIAKVYHYFEQEYEALKRTYMGLGLTPLLKCDQRTALATGVSESTVVEILQEEGRRNADMRQEQLRKQSQAGVKEKPLETLQEDTLVGKEEPFETYEEHEIVKVEHGVCGANLELADRLLLDVETDPWNEEATNSNETLAVQPDTKHYKGRIHPDPCAPPGPSTPAGLSASPSPCNSPVRSTSPGLCTPPRPSTPPDPTTPPRPSTPLGTSAIPTPRKYGNEINPNQRQVTKSPSVAARKRQESTERKSRVLLHDASSRKRRTKNEVNQNQRQVTYSPVKTRSVAARKRQQLTEHKQASQLHRVLLPDAPPRKRRARRPSPHREPCVFVEPNTSQEVKKKSTVSFEVKPESSLDETRPLDSTEPLNDTEYLAIGPGTEVVVMDLEVQQDGTVVPIQPSLSPPLLEELTSLVDEAGAAVDATSTSAGLTQSGVSDVTDSRFTQTVQDWIDLADLSDDNDNDDNNAFLLASDQERNAMTEPACVSDMTMFQAEVLQREDAANDQALRDIVPDDFITFNWNKDTRTFLGRRETFSGTSGPTFEVTDQTQPTDIFDKMINTDLIDLLVTETNRYAEQRIALLREQNKLKPASRYNRWFPTNRDEMISFLAILILQGLYPLTDEEGYFNFNGFGTLTYFSRIMSYNRFALLKSFFHFVDNETVQDTTRLSKIRPVLDYFNDRFSSLYMPSQDIAIDESLLKWHGRLSFAQKISSKAAQVGVKTYELCESSSGYLWKYFVYTGKDKPTAENATSQPDEQSDRPTINDDDERNDGLDNDKEPTDRTTGGSGDRPTNATAKIVYDLVEPLLNRGHTIIMDNFYNSPLLCRSLKRQRTDCYGTLRLNREFVPASIKTLSMSELRQGEVVATYCSDLSILVWRDANIVSMISTYHDLQVGTQDKYNRVTYKPKIVLDYNKSMGGVYRKDQFLSSHRMERARNKVWYKKLFRRIYNAAVFNCFVIFSSVHRKVSHRQFRTVLAEDLIKRHRQIDLSTETRNLPVRSRTSGQVINTVRCRVNKQPYVRTFLEHNHLPVLTGTRNSTCRMAHPKRVRTSYKCEECDVPLCIVPCFRSFHKHS